MKHVEKIAKIMALHSVNFVTNVQKSQILVEEVYTKDKTKGSNWIDATEWDLAQVKDWLGY